MKRLKYLSDIDLSTIRIAIGGIGLKNKFDNNFSYDSTIEGFSGIFRCS